MDPNVVVASAILKESTKNVGTSDVTSNSWFAPFTKGWAWIKGWFAADETPEESELATLTEECFYRLCESKKDTGPVTELSRRRRFMIYIDNIVVRNAGPATKVLLDITLGGSDIPCLVRVARKKFAKLRFWLRSEVKQKLWIAGTLGHREKPQVVTLSEKGARRLEFSVCREWRGSYKATETEAIQLSLWEIAPLPPQQMIGSDSLTLRTALQSPGSHSFKFGKEITVNCRVGAQEIFDFFFKFKEVELTVERPLQQVDSEKRPLLESSVWKVMLLFLRTDLEGFDIPPTRFSSEPKTASKKGSVKWEFLGESGYRSTFAAIMENNVLVVIQSSGAASDAFMSVAAGLLSLSGLASAEGCKFSSELFAITAPPDGLESYHKAVTGGKQIGSIVGIVSHSGPLPLYRSCGTMAGTGPFMTVCIKSISNVARTADLIQANSELRYEVSLMVRSKKQKGLEGTHSSRLSSLSDVAMIAVPVDEALLVQIKKIGGLQGRAKSPVILEREEKALEEKIRALDDYLITLDLWAAHISPGLEQRDQHLGWAGVTLLTICKKIAASKADPDSPEDVSVLVDLSFTMWSIVSVPASEAQSLTARVQFALSPSLSATAGKLFSDIEQTEEKKDREALLEVNKYKSLYVTDERNQLISVLEPDPYPQSEVVSNIMMADVIARSIPNWSYLENDEQDGVLRSRRFLFSRHARLSALEKCLVQAWLMRQTGHKAYAALGMLRYGRRDFGTKGPLVNEAKRSKYFVVGRSSQLTSIWDVNHLMVYGTNFKMKNPEALTVWGCPSAFVSRPLTCITGHVDWLIDETVAYRNVRADDGIIELDFDVEQRDRWLPITLAEISEQRVWRNIEIPETAIVSPDETRILGEQIEQLFATESFMRPIYAARIDLSLDDFLREGIRILNIPANANQAGEIDTELRGKLLKGWISVLQSKVPESFGVSLICGRFLTPVQSVKNLVWKISVTSRVARESLPPTSNVTQEMRPT